LSAFIWSPSAGAGAEQAVATTAGAEQELKRLSVAWMQAWKERDRATLERLLLRISFLSFPPQLSGP